MADLKKYRVRVNNYETVLQLDERGAKARGLGDKDLFKPAASKPAGGSKQAAKPAEKQAAAPENKQAAPAADK